MHVHTSQLSQHSTLMANDCTHRASKALSLLPDFKIEAVTDRAFRASAIDRCARAAVHGALRVPRQPAVDTQRA